MARQAATTGKSREQLIQEARDSLPGFDGKSKYNFAVCGESRSGKSTMVNALLGVKDDDPGAARVGEIETTMEITKYEIPNGHLVVWDLPGCGTSKHPFEGYFEDKKLYAFDALILAYKDGLTENTVKLYEQCMERKVNVALVRTHVDQAWKSKCRRGITSDDDIVAALREDFNKELEQLGVQGSLLTNTFYVSMRDFMDNMGKMDEIELINMMYKAASKRAGGTWNPRVLYEQYLKAQTAPSNPTTTKIDSSLSTRGTELMPPAPLPPRTIAGNGRTQDQLFHVLYDFAGQKSKQVRVAAGDFVTLIQDLQENGWSLVETSSGNRGLVPTAYIEPILEDVEPAPPPPPPSARAVAQATTSKSSALCPVCTKSFTDGGGKYALHCGHFVCGEDAKTILSLPKVASGRRCPVCAVAL